MDAPVEALGINVAARVAWLAPVVACGSLLGDRSDRLELADSAMTEERALSEFEESAEAVLGRLEPHGVALLDSGKSRRPPPPSQSRLRGQLEAVLLIACARTGSPVSRVSHDAVEQTLGSRPAAADFPGHMAERLTAPPPSRWAERSRAYAAAMVLLQKHHA